LTTEPPTISYVTFRPLEPQTPAIAGQLRIPKGGRQPVAAVVIVHGSAGIDSRGGLYAEALNHAGIATLEVDLWAARGWLGRHRGHPEGVPATLPDAYGALHGFSWGGTVAMLTATRFYTKRYCPDQLKFAAHAPFYPVCWAYNTVPGYEFHDLTGAPVLIQTGELDTYDAPGAGRTLLESLPKEAQSLVSLEVYPGTTHAFNRLEPAITVNDPFAHQGRGGEVTFTPNLEAAALSLEKTVQFFEQALGPAA
jgi:dienelactone hydrolase